LAIAAALAPASAQASATMFVGAASDWPRSKVFEDSKAQFELARSAGLSAIRTTALWSPGMTEPSAEQISIFETTAQAAALSGIKVIVSVYPASNRQVPLDAAARAEFASYAAGLARGVPLLRDFIIGNEPNLNSFWLPQYNARGKSAAPAAYVLMLATTYDAIKGVDPTINVIGGSVSPRGTDRPLGRRPSHSPGNFILAMGKAYKRLGRTIPMMDQFAFHPYGERSKTPPWKKNPRSTTISISDYEKLVGYLGQAFARTGQPGSSLPIVYDEFGVQTTIPTEKAALYTNADSAVATDAVDEATQALYYKRALEIAARQPNVVGFLFFGTVDEADLRRWQSGLFYPDFTPKSSLPVVSQSLLSLKAG
jgi:hypothetical protein